jgi:DNA repair protein RecN (Recombination protein N)
MLLSLCIENFALIDRLELQFGAGLNVLTGETGAGKSIVLDAIDIVLGGKANQRAIRSGEDRALLEGVFRVDDRVRNWLILQEIETEENTLICAREGSRSGESIKSKLRVNGTLLNRKLSDELRELLIEIAAQGQTLQLTNPQHQRELLDSYGGEGLIQLRRSVEKVYEIYQTTNRELIEQQATLDRRQEKIELLQFQYRELDKVNLGEPDELDRLIEESQRLSHVVDLQQQSYLVYQLLYQNDDGETPAVTDLLGKAELTLSSMVEIDGSLQPTLDLVSNALAQISEAARDINYYGDGLEADPQRLNEIEDRLRTLKQICRKYGPNLTDAIANYDRIATELTQLNSGEETIASLTATLAQLAQELDTTCAHLTQKRQQAATELAINLIAELKPLAMDKVQFEVKISPQSPTATGGDRIEFYFSPNPGEPLHPLAETASGGEMSRFLLALKACFSTADSVGTLIFDEIDAGVSGKVAQAIADKLHHLSRRHQILCVTHQPLVAAMADRHFRVAKEVNVDRERTSVKIEELLDRDRRRDEIAQIAGGRSATEAIAFATSLLSQAETNKQNQQPISSHPAKQKRKKNSL